MIIAINARYLSLGFKEGFGNFTSETFYRIAANQPKHTFIFIYDRDFNIQNNDLPNIKHVKCTPKARHPLLWYYWNQIKITLLLKKYKADVYISVDGFISYFTKVKQISIIHDLAYLHYPNHVKKSHLFFYKNNLPKVVKKATAIATVSEFTKQDIIEIFKTNTDKINVVYSGTKSIFKTVPFREQELIREQYSNGVPYLVSVGSIHPRKNMINVLKAFSIFKQNQKTNMKLIFAGRMAWNVEEFNILMNSYKYKNDVIITGYLEDEECAKLVGAASQLIYASLWEGFGVPPLEAMQAGVPVICSNVSSMPEISGFAAVYVNPEDYKSIAQGIQELYKNENFAQSQIEKGFEQAKKYSWDKTASLVWEIIHKITK